MVRIIILSLVLSACGKSSSKKDDALPEVGDAPIDGPEETKQDEAADDTTKDDTELRTLQEKAEAAESAFEALGFNVYTTWTDVSAFRQKVTATLTTDPEVFKKVLVATPYLLKSDVKKALNSYAQALEALDAESHLLSDDEASDVRARIGVAGEAMESPLLSAAVEVEVPEGLIMAVQRSEAELAKAGYTFAIDIFSPDPAAQDKQKMNVKITSTISAVIESIKDDFDNRNDEAAKRKMALFEEYEAALTRLGPYKEHLFASFLYEYKVNEVVPFNEKCRKVKMRFGLADPVAQALVIPSWHSSEVISL